MLKADGFDGAVIGTTMLTMRRQLNSLSLMLQAHTWVNKRPSLYIQTLRT